MGDLPTTVNRLPVIASVPVSGPVVKPDLTADQHAVLVKLCQQKNYWEFLVRVLTADMDLAPVHGAALSVVDVVAIQEQNESIAFCINVMQVIE